MSAISRPLRFRIYGPIVLLITSLFLAVEAYAFTSGQLLSAARHAVNNPSSSLLVIGLIVVSIFVHEMGHASGCRYGGATPGALGVGIYVSTLAFFTDVSDTYRLGRSGRIRADLGGVYFNAVYAVAVFSIFLITGSSLLLLLVAAMTLEIVEQMLPFVRFDGYWAISDLAGVPDLFSYLRSVLRRGGGAEHKITLLTPASRRLVKIWGLLTVIVLPIEAVVGLVALPPLAVASWNAIERHAHVLSQQQSTAAMVLAGLGILFTAIVLGAMIYGVVYIASRIVQFAVRNMSTPAHRMARAYPVHRLARATWVMSVIAVPVAWSATQVRLR